MVGMGKGAEHGILFKSGPSLEKAHRVNAIVFDKTGTLTKGRPAVTDVLALDNHNEDEILKFASIAEKSSEHPLGQAIIQKAKQAKITIENANWFATVLGKGVRAKYTEKDISLGNRKLMEDKQWYRTRTL